MNFDTIKKAGLTQNQFAALVGVSRVTVNTWIKGHFNPQARLRARVRKALDLLDRAVYDGVLPVPANHQEKELERRLSDIETALLAEV